VSALLGGLTPGSFLARHWQKQPLLVRGALPDFRDPLSPDELSGLACEADVESRLVLERGGTRPWQVIVGPQHARRLRRLPPTHWTLLVQEANLHVPALAALLERFAFIPHWRVDDVMVSLAPRFGTVGPHVDSYDVFLLQGKGRRRWRIARSFGDDIVPGIDLRVLRRFRAEQEWVLEPGDMLYLPPGLAHHGVALETCLTYSIGFRAPSHADLVLAYLQRVVRGVDRDQLYGDPDLVPQRHAGEITNRARRRIRRILAEALAPGPGRDFDRFVGALLTQPKSAAPRAHRSSLRPHDVARRLAGSRALARSEASRLAFVRNRDGSADLFADGRCHELPRSLGFAAPLLTGRRLIPADALVPLLGRRGFTELVAALVSDGALSFVPRRRRS
jgi:50S ribosomal protein L16 3-hydroxylase